MPNFSSLSLRRVRWEAQVGWDEGDLDRQYSGREVLQEDLQDQSVPTHVEKAVLETDIVWQEIDYLEGARYVALNWSEEKCRSSKLARILPRRRKATGSHPGLRGARPQGAGRGDQEQESGSEERRGGSW